MAVKKALRAQKNGGAWQRRAEHRPEEIVAAARALLEQRGYAAVSMAEIARRAGVSEATVYKYFKNRQDLLNQVLREWATPFLEDLQREIALVTGLRAKLTLIATRYLRGMEQTPRLHRVVYQEVRWNDYIGSPLHGMNAQYAGIAVQAIQDAIRDGEAAPSSNANTVRDMLFGGLEHVGQRTIFAGRPVNIEMEAATLANLLVDGLAPRSTTATADGRGEDVAGLLARLQRAVATLQSRPDPNHTK
jgi:TetR/AcrR family transcriptional regulator, fatty acid metabolism regulator protein